MCIWQEFAFLVTFFRITWQKEIESCRHFRVTFFLNFFSCDKEQQINSCWPSVITKCFLLKSTVIRFQARNIQNIGSILTFTCVHLYTINVESVFSFEKVPQKLSSVLKGLKGYCTLIQGVSETVLGKQPSFSVVSNGAECIMLNRQFYLENAPVALITKMRNNVRVIYDCIAY